MAADSDHHLARITPVATQRAGRVIGRPFLLVQTISIFLFSSGWCGLAMLGLLLCGVRTGLSIATGMAVLVLAALWAVLFFSMMFVYPEWPHNLRLCRRLRSSVGRSSGSSEPDPSSRVVELVPRQRWNGICLDTATDLMLMQIDEHGVWMSGDHFDYQLPSESILGAQYHAIRPPGWFCRSHMVLIYVRTDEGTLELPISYRDHRWGNLRSSRRRAAAIELTQRVAGIAKGSRYQPQSILIDPVPHDRVPGVHSALDNPYSPPTSVDHAPLSALKVTNDVVGKYHRH